MKKRNFSFCLAISIVFIASCGGKHPTSTVENLKRAAAGESNASAHYAAFSQMAMEEGYINVANMFAAISFSESLHAARHMKELTKLGVVDFKPVVDSIVVNNTLENLKRANEGEVYEFTSMYPSFIEIAKSEKANGALVSFDFANRAEIKHSGFYAAALSDLGTSTIGDLTFNSKWIVCPVCGDTYSSDFLGTFCELCGKPVTDFIVFEL